MNDKQKWRQEHKDEIRKYNRKYRETHKEQIKKYQKYHKEYWRKYYREHREQIKERMEKYNKEIRMKVIELLGGKCIKCGFNDWRALQIDHVHGGGCKERKTIRDTHTYYYHVIKEVQSGNKDYQLLCANCNQIKKYEKKEFRNVLVKRDDEK